MQMQKKKNTNVTKYKMAKNKWDECKRTKYIHEKNDNIKSN